MQGTLTEINNHARDTVPCAKAIIIRKIAPVDDSSHAIGDEVKYRIPARSNNRYELLQVLCETTKTPEGTKRKTVPNAEARAESVAPARIRAKTREECLAEGTWETVDGQALSLQSSTIEGCMHMIESMYGIEIPGDVAERIRMRGSALYNDVTWQRHMIAWPEGTVFDE